MEWCARQANLRSDISISELRARLRSQHSTQQSLNLPTFGATEDESLKEKIETCNHRCAENFTEGDLSNRSMRLVFNINR